MDDLILPEGWTVIADADLLAILRRAAGGEHPDLLMVEVHANAAVYDEHNTPAAAADRGVEVLVTLRGRAYGLATVTAEPGDSWPELSAGLVRVFRRLADDIENRDLLGGRGEREDGT